MKLNNFNKSLFISIYPQYCENILQLVVSQARSHISYILYELDHDLHELEFMSCI